MRLDEEEHRAGRQAGRWLDVKQAAEELGISSDAVRKRIARGTLRFAKQEDGTVRVWLDSVDEQRDGDQPNSWTEAGHRLDELVNAKDDALRDLRDQLEHMRRE
jgi:excisionase family DNA binding protein